MKLRNSSRKKAGEVRAKRMFSRDRVLLAIGVVLFITLVTAFVYAVNFLRNTIVPALSPNVPDSGEVIKFDFEAYERLGLENRGGSVQAEGNTSGALPSTATSVGE